MNLSAPDKFPQTAELDRREFICGCAALLLGGLCIAGCAGTKLFQLSAQSSGDISLTLSDFELSADKSGALLVSHPQLEDPLLLLRDPAGGFMALSSRCTHMNCRVRAAGAQIICPCHGSVFSREGRVLRGPAPSDLPTYPVRVVDGIIYITPDVISKTP